MIAGTPSRLDDAIDWLIARIHRRRAVQQQERAPEPVIVAAPPPIQQGDGVVDWIRAYRDRYGRDPSIRAVQHEFALSKSTAWRRLRAS
jgi:hypothetical protein